MATNDDNEDKLKDAEDGAGEASSEESSEAEGAETENTAGEAIEPAAADDAPAELAEPGEGDDAVEGAHTLGSERYVHAAFFAAGILAAYIASKTLVLAWNQLAGWPAAVRAVPQLVSLTEEQRDSYALVAGAAVG